MCASGARAATRSFKWRERSLYSETLREAVLALGDEQSLAARLGAEVDFLKKWLAGEERPPLRAFLESLDVIAEAPWRVREAN